MCFNYLHIRTRVLLCSWGDNMKVINPNAPDEYKYETDYRKIPREYLNPRIPQGRGMVKWQAFKTLPEQYEQLEQYIQDQNKIDKPSLSDDQLNDLNYLFL